MAEVGKALVVGGGVGGMTAALRLAGIGVEVDLVDSDPHWKPYGAGLTITGPSLRAFRDLGVLEEIRARGYIGRGMRTSLMNGALLPAPPPPGDDIVHSSGGILRAHLHEILAARVRGSAVTVRLGVGLATIENGTQPLAGFSDGTSGRYDLVVASDGIFSTARRLVFPEAPAPKFTGQGCWRVVAPRPAEVDRVEIVVDGPIKLGLVPISQTHMYMFILEHVPDNPRRDPAVFIPHLKEIMAPYAGRAGGVRDGLGPDSMISYRPLEWLLLPRPWFRERVLLIGDAAHATTPHLASGAGLAVEDGLVLSEELAKAETVETALASFMERRFERARMVVENSIRIGEMEMANESPAQAGMMMGRTMAAMAAPY